MPLACIAPTAAQRWDSTRTPLLFVVGAMQACGSDAAAAAGRATSKFPGGMHRERARGCRSCVAVREDRRRASRAPGCALDNGSLAVTPAKAKAKPRWGPRALWRSLRPRRQPSPLASESFWVTARPSSTCVWLCSGLSVYRRYIGALSAACTIRSSQTARAVRIM